MKTSRNQKYVVGLGHTWKSSYSRDEGRGERGDERLVKTIVSHCERDQFCVYIV
jgi:hypothetical protein